jgi:hypothetical protein
MPQRWHPDAGKGRGGRLFIAGTADHAAKKKPGALEAPGFRNPDVSADDQVSSRS